MFIYGNSSFVRFSKFNFSFDYNKIHPLIGDFIIINLSSSLSSLYYNWQNSDKLLRLCLFFPNCKETKLVETLLFDPRLTPYPKTLTFCWTHHPPKNSVTLYLSSPVLHKQPTRECLTTIISVVIVPFERCPLWIWKKLVSKT